MQLQRSAYFRFQPLGWGILVIGCSQNSGFTVAKATNTLLSNNRGLTSTLLGRIMSSNGGFCVCHGVRVLLYGLPSLAVLPISPANKRRDSDQYAESRRNLSADGEQCRTSGTIGGGLNGSQCPAHRCPGPSEILWALPCMKCSSFGPV